MTGGGDLGNASEPTAVAQEQGVNDGGRASQRADPSDGALRRKHAGHCPGEGEGEHWSTHTSVTGAGGGFDGVAVARGLSRQGSTSPRSTDLGGVPDELIDANDGLCRFPTGNGSRQTGDLADGRRQEPVGIEERGESFYRWGARTCSAGREPATAGSGGSACRSSGWE